MSLKLDELLSLSAILDFQISTIANQLNRLFLISNATQSTAYTYQLLPLQATGIKCPKKRNKEHYYYASLVNFNLWCCLRIEEVV